MPNWCNNVVTLSHEDPAMLERARAAFARGALLQEFIPCPEDLQNTMAGSHGADVEKQAALEAQEAANLAKYGHKNWHDWRVANWGTKWDIGSEDGAELVGDVLQLSFDSAWGPPIEFYNQMVELGFTVEAYYHEPGMQFAGSYTNDGGEYTVSYAEWTADQIRKYIPELDERFCISEMIEQNEDV